MEQHLDILYQNIKLAATLHIPSGTGQAGQDGRYPAVLICHGFVGNRIGVNRLFVKAARELADNGYVVLRFDYAGCGESEGEYGSYGVDSLVDQTRFVLDYLLDLPMVDPQRVTLLGHSLGGAVAVLTAASDKRVSTLVLWAPVGQPFKDIVAIVGKEIYEEVVLHGSTEYLGYTLGQTFFQSLSTVHPLMAAKDVSGDVLLIHGSDDRDISAEYSFLYQKVFRMRNSGLSEKEILPQADHCFTTRGHAAQVIKRTVEWLKQKEEFKQGWYGWSI